MENAITQTNLDKFYRKELKKHGKSKLERIIQEKRTTQNNDAKKIFLCHCHKDKTIVPRIKILFAELDADVYVDWLDKDLPPFTNNITASTIQKKIQDCDKFVFLATTRALESKWCNWELGLAYSVKKITDLAILPIKSFSGRWKGNEYLKLYPLMQVDDSNLEMLNLNKVEIVDLDGISITLQNWLL